MIDSRFAETMPPPRVECGRDTFGAAVARWPDHSVTAVLSQVVGTSTRNGERGRQMNKGQKKKAAKQKAKAKTTKKLAVELIEKHRRVRIS